MLTKQQGKEALARRENARKKSEQLKEKAKNDYYDNLLKEINRGLHGS